MSSPADEPQSDSLFNRALELTQYYYEEWEKYERWEERVRHGWHARFNRALEDGHSMSAAIRIANANVEDPT